MIKFIEHVGRYFIMLQKMLPFTARKSTSASGPSNPQRTLARRNTSLGSGDRLKNSRCLPDKGFLVLANHLD